MTQGNLTALFQPGNIGSMALKNRLIMAPMGTNMADADGAVTDLMISYYEARARGGVGMIMVEGACVDLVGRATPLALMASDDRFVPGLKRLADAIDRHGCKPVLQLNHCGRLAPSNVTGQQAVGPSAVAAKDWSFDPLGEGIPPRAMTMADIDHTISQFAKAADRARRAGFAGVEVHAAHGYLVSQFLSGAINKRQDTYGGSVKNRARFLLDILQAIRALCGAGYPVWCRLSAKEYGMESGITLDETLEVVQLVQSAGAAAIDVSVYGASQQRIPLSGIPRGYLLRFAEAVKKVISVPVIGVGRLTVEVGEQALIDATCDFIAIGKGLIADPDLPNKAAAGRIEDIAPCICCGTCLDLVLSGQTIGCSVNAQAGRENEPDIGVAPQRKKVVVVGGGPAGMEAARVAALRGHQVTLCERDPLLGGQVRLAMLPPFKASIGELTDYLEGQIRKLGVKVLLNAEATSELIDGLSPDVIIIAAGSSPLTPHIPGIDGAQVVQAADVLLGKANVGKTVAIIGGERVGCETAEYLARQEKRVVLMRRSDAGIASGMPPIAREAMLHRLSRLGVEMLSGVNYEEITDEGVRITKDAEPQLIRADTVVVAAGTVPESGLYDSLRETGVEIHKVGDCVAVGNIIEAVSGAFAVARYV